MAPPDIISRAESVAEEDSVEKSNSELNKRLLEIQWNQDEEKHILRRLDFYLIPLVMVMFFTLNLDRCVGCLLRMRSRLKLSQRKYLQCTYRQFDERPFYGSRIYKHGKQPRLCWYLHRRHPSKSHDTKGTKSAPPHAESCMYAY